MKSIEQQAKLSMATAVGILNPEPSLPAEREKQHLPPKTYEQAVEENLSNGHMNEASTPDIRTRQEKDYAAAIAHAKKQQKSSSVRANGNTKEKKESSIVTEKYTDKDGEHLVSLRGATKQPRRTNSELVSGKKAGERWQQSP